MGPGSGESTKTTQNILSPQQEEILGLAMPGIRSFAATVPQRYSGSAVAGFDPSQVAGQDAALAAAPTQAGIAGNAANANQFFTGGDIWNPASNPHLQGAIDASTRPIVQNYQETVLPGIRNDAVASGNFGSSRQGVAEGIAARGMSNAVGDTASRVVQGQYGTNIEAQLKAMGLAPSVQQAQTVPATTTSGVGDVRQALAQRMLGENVGNFNYDQLAPFLQAQELTSLLSGIPGGGTQSTANNATQNPWGQSLGGALTGATAGSAFGPVGTGVGAVGGAVLPWVFRQ